MVDNERVTIAYQTITGETFDSILEIKADKNSTKEQNKVIRKYILDCIVEYLGTYDEQTNSD